MPIARRRVEGLGWALVIAFLALGLFAIAVMQSDKVRDEIWSTLGGVGVESLLLGVPRRPSHECHPGPTSTERRVEAAERLPAPCSARHRHGLPPGKGGPPRASRRPPSNGRAASQWSSTSSSKPTSVSWTDRWRWSGWVRESRQRLGILTEARQDQSHRILRHGEASPPHHPRMGTSGPGGRPGRPMRAKDWPKLRGFLARGDTGESTFDAGVASYEDFLEAAIRYDMANDARSEPSRLDDPEPPKVPAEADPGGPSGTAIGQGAGSASTIALG